MHVSATIKKPLYRSYLRHICDISEGNIHLVNRRSDFGKFLCSMVRESHKPVQHQESEDTVFFKLPNTKSLKLSNASFAYILKTDQLKVEDFLEACFKIDFDRFYLDGLAMQKQQKDVIEAFIVSRGLLLFDNEMLKKRKYREGQRQLSAMVKKLRDAADHRARRIDSLVEPYLTHYKMA